MTVRPSPELVSVVIPLRNGERWIADQLAALAAQRYPRPWEVVVADNGSTDAGVAAVLAFRDRLPALRVVDAGARRGINHARNAGADAAHGDLLLFCDADDVVGAGWIAAMVRAARDADLVGGRLRWDLLNGELALSWHATGEMAGLSTGHGSVPHPAGGNLAVWTSVARRLGWDERFAYGSSDREFSWRAHLSGLRVAFAPEAVVQQRLRAGLRAVARQQYVYGMSEVKLVRAFRAHRPARADQRAALERWRWLWRNRGDLRASPQLRGQWVRRAALRAGRLAGTLRYRALHL